MRSFPNYQYDFPTLFASQQNSLVLVYSLWIGVGILTLLSIILIWTRWGHAKPLSKCIALSIFAHILLGGYAYGTRLIFNYSKTDQSDTPVAFSVIEEVEVDPTEMEDPSDSNDQAEESWEKFADSQNESPQTIKATKLESHQASVPERKIPDKPIEFQQHQIKDAVSSASTTPPSAPGLNEDEFDIPKNDKSFVEPTKIAETTEPIRKPEPVNNENLDTAVPDSKFANRLDNKPDTQPETPATPIRPNEVSSENLKQNLANQVSRQNAELVPGPSEIEDANSVPEPVKSDSFRQVAQQNSSSQIRNPQIPVPRVSQFNNRRIRLADGQPIPEVYQNRFVQNRSLLIQQSGGIPKSQVAVEEALKWLGAEQADDGRWNPRKFNAGNEANVYGHNRGGAGFNADTGITGLVLLSFLGAGHTHLEGPYQKNVQKGLEYLIRTQNQDGSMYGEAGLFARTYCHGMALMALAEAYSLTGDHRIKPFLDKAQNFTVATQNKTTGGWRYRPGDDGDMSQFGWQVMALKSCELAGVPIPEKTNQLMKRFLQNYAKGKSGGLSAYRPAEKPSRTMTAEAIFCRRLLGMPVSAAMSKEAVDFVLEELPGSNRIDNLYFWYYATLAIHKEQAAFEFQKRNWTRWNRALTQRILELQNKKGQAGSFSDKTLWSAYGGRFYSTAIAALCLEAHYRYKPASTTGNRTARR